MSERKEDWVEDFSNEEIKFAVKIIHHMRVIGQYDKVTIKKNDGVVALDITNQHRDTFEI